MQVKAKSLGYYGIERKRPGQIFEMANKDVFKRLKDGKPAYDQESGDLVLCKWIEPLESLERLGVPLSNCAPVAKKPAVAQTQKPTTPQTKPTIPLTATKE